MKKIFSVVLFLISLLILTVSCKPPKDLTSFEAMNTFMTLQTYGNKAKKANLVVQNRIMELENSISTTKECSTIYKLNHSPEYSISADDDTYKLVTFALDIANQTNGALNIALYPIISTWGFTTGNYRIPSGEEISELLTHTDYKKIQIAENRTISIEPKMQLDLGAIGKGYAGDEAVRILEQCGIKSAILDLGGNIQTLGAKPDGSDWMIGIKNPWDGSVAAGVRIRNQAVITSGGYERFFTGEDGKDYIHIFNGETGAPVENDLASVTIIAESGVYGDALSTAMFVLGLEKSCEYWNTHRDFEMIIITKDQKLYFTSGLKEKLSPRYEFSEIEIIK